MPSAGAINLPGLDWRAVAVVGGLVVLAAIYSRQQLSSAAGDIASAINPTNPENVFSEAVNATGEAVTGQPGWTIGGAVYDAGRDPDGRTNAIGQFLDWLIL